MYSQGKEEEVIQRYCGKMALPRGVLDIGAGDGVTYSNSAKLIEMGWNATLVEPSPHAFTKLFDRYKDTKRVNLINAAVGTEQAHLLEFNECITDDMYSTLAQGKIIEKMEYRSFWVPTVSVKQVIRQGLVPQADVISIDTEGTAFSILKDIPLDALRPVVIVIEHDSRMVEISKWADTKNYHPIMLDDQNLVLVWEG